MPHARLMPCACLLLVVACHGRSAPPATGSAAPSPGSAAPAAATDLDIDVPRLDSVTGTLALPPGLVVAATSATTNATYAADRSRPAAPMLDALAQRGIRAPRFVVIAGGAKRTIVIELPKPIAAGGPTAITTVHVGASTFEINGVVVAAPELRSKLAAVEYVALALDHDAPMQRLAELASAAGGMLHLVPPPSVQAAP